MPNRAPQACNAPSCWDVCVPGTQYCPKHQRDPKEGQRARDAKRYRDNPYRKWYNSNAWKNLRVFVLNRDPLCKLQITPMCKQHGGDGTSVADHIHDHKGVWALFIDPANVQGVCKPCHDAKIKELALNQPRTEIQIAPTGSNIPGVTEFMASAHPEAIEAALADDDDLDDVRIPGT